MLIPASSQIIIHDLIDNDHIDIHDISVATHVGVATLYYVLQGRTPSAKTEHNLLSYYIQRKLGLTGKPWQPLTPSPYSEHPRTPKQSN